MVNAGQRRYPNGHQRELAGDLERLYHHPTRFHARGKPRLRDLVNCSGNGSWLGVGKGPDPIKERHEGCSHGAVELAQGKPLFVGCCL
jgi:hypothetical protein